MPKKGLGVSQIGLSIILCGDIRRRRWVIHFLCECVYINIVITIALFNSIFICATFIGFGARQVLLQVAVFVGCRCGGNEIDENKLFCDESIFKLVPRYFN